MSTATGEQVVADTVRAAEAVFGSDIEAIYALGSLAHGGFAPLVSDVDVAVILRTTGPETAGRIERLQQMVVRQASNPLADRLSVFWGDWQAVRAGQGDHYRLGPVDRLDLLESGRLLVGSDRREPSIRPSHAELVAMSADHILSRFTDEHLESLQDTEALVDGGPRAVTKAVLFPVRFTYTLRTGRIGLNDSSATWYAEEGLPGGALALQALTWRREGITDSDVAQQLLEAELAALHAECFDQYALELDSIGDNERAAGLAHRAALVRIATSEAR